MGVCVDGRSVDVTTKTLKLLFTTVSAEVYGEAARFQMSNLSHSTEDSEVFGGI